MNRINFHLPYFSIFQIDQKFFTCSVYNYKKIVTIAVTALSFLVLAIIAYNTYKNSKNKSSQWNKKDKHIYSKDLIIEGDLDDTLTGQGKIIGPGYMKKGKFKRGLLHGLGKFVLAFGNNEQGEFENDKLNGQGIVIKEDNTKLEGKFKDGLLYNGTITCTNGVIYKGEFQNDKLNGSGSIIVVDDYKKEGSFKNGLLNGQGVITFSNGKKHEGEFQNNVFKKGKITDKRSIEEGEFINDCLHGQGVRHVLDKETIEEGQFENGELKSGSVTAKKRGIKWEGEFKSGELHGKGKYTKDNQTIEGTFVNGKLQSP